MINKPEVCCDFGEYGCQVPMAIGGKRVDIDICIADIVAALNAGNIVTLASCCGHNKIPGTIILEDGREIIIVQNAEERNRIIELLKIDKSK